MKVIAVFTETGTTARLISKNRPRPRSSPSLTIRIRGGKFRFCGACCRAGWASREIWKIWREMAEQRLLEERLVSRGDVVGIVAGNADWRARLDKLHEIPRRGGPQMFRTKGSAARRSS